MKKSLIMSFAVTVLVNSICFAINMFFATIYHVLPLGISISGGECIEHIGFGVNLSEIFYLTIDESGGSTYSVSFEFYSLLISLVVVFVISLLVYIIINKIKENKKK